MARACVVCVFKVGVRHLLLSRLSDLEPSDAKKALLVVFFRKLKSHRHHATLPLLTFLVVVVVVAGLFF